MLKINPFKLTTVEAQKIHDKVVGFEEMRGNITPHNLTVVARLSLRGAIVEEAKSRNISRYNEWREKIIKALIRNKSWLEKQRVGCTSTVINVDLKRGEKPHIKGYKVDRSRESEETVIPESFFDSIYKADDTALLRKIIVSFRKVIFLCSLLRIKKLIQIIYQ
ncbi:hypothetical protein [Piscirickettsia salmonis]|uniref:hypothetical protein n=1 Tax=Piscirickettsia salmonis TaxID=1238 RepID=UPI003A802B7B